MTLPKSEFNHEAAPISNSEPSKPGLINNREYVRIYYSLDWPSKYIPELTIRYKTYQLLDISETGICFRIPRLNLLSEDIIVGSIKFTDESVIEFSGVVVRRTKEQIALKLIIGIPYSYIASEQVRLRNLEAERVISYVKK